MQKLEIDLQWLDRSQLFRVQVLKWMSFILLIAALIYGTINLLLLKQTLLGLLELSFAVYSAYVYCYAEIKRRHISHSALYIILLNAIVLTAIFLAPGSVTLYAWLFICPTCAYLLLGREWGFKLNLLLIPVGIAVYTWSVYLHGDMSLLRSTLNVGVCLLAIWAIAHTYEKHREYNEQQLTSLAILDPLTQLDNRLSLALNFEKMVSQHRRKTDVFSMLVVDLDFFKAVNDRYGHDIGDQVLKQVANQLRDSVRVSDQVFRVGGEEFCVLLPYTERHIARAVAEHVRKELSRHTFKVGEHSISLSASIGLAEYGQDGLQLEEMFKTADELLYTAKGSGRNQVAYGL